MANSTVLQLVQSFAREYGLPQPGSIQGSSDAGALQMRELLIAVGEHIWSVTNWQECSVRAVWTSVSGEDQGVLQTLFPLQFAHIVPRTFWDLTARIAFNGPLMDSTWQNQKAVLSASPFYRFKITGNHLLVSPNMPAGHSLSLFYKSKAWIADGGGGANKTSFTTDSDSSLFPDRIMKLGLKAFWLRTKQMPHRFEMEMFEDATLQEGSINTVRPILSLDQENTPQIGIAIPLGGWTLP